MKYCFCVFSLLLAGHTAYGDINWHEIDKMVEECKDEVGLKNDTIRITKRTLLEPKVKCFFTCFEKRRGKIVDGKIDADKYLEFAKKFYPDLNATTEARVVECVDTANKVPDECELIVTVDACIVEALGPPPSLMQKRKDVRDCTAEVEFANATDVKQVYSKLKCLHACLDKKWGILIDGKLDADKTVELMKRTYPRTAEREDFEEEVRKCIAEANEKTDECEVVGAAHECFFAKFRRARNHLTATTIGPD